MAYKPLVIQLAGANNSPNNALASISIFDDSNGNYIQNADVWFNASGITNSNEYRTAANAAIIAWGSNNGYTWTDNDILLYPPNDLPVQSSVSHSITTSTGSSGFQVSSDLGADVNYSCTIVTSATLAASASGTIVLEIAPTNSATPGDWVEISRMTNGQAFSLAVAIGCTQTISSTLSGYVPKGYYAKLRSINNSGTPTFTYNSGQETLRAY